jgi:hypothetical protein
MRARELEHDMKSWRDQSERLAASGLNVLAERDAARKGYADACKALSNAWAERDALRQELEALRASAEPVAEVVAKEPYLDGTPRGNELRWSGRNCEDDLPIGTKLYACPVQASAGPAETQGGTDWRELARRLYVELFYCNRQMTTERKKWKQGPSVRDALADAKSALDEHPAGASPQPAPAREGRVQRLQAAIEGECGGLAIDTIHALAILLYVDGDDTAREGSRGEYLTDADDERAREGRQPLTPTQVEALSQQNGFDGGSGAPKWIFELVRDIEHAHGIGSAKGDEA